MERRETTNGSVVEYNEPFSCGGSDERLAINESEILKLYPEYPDIFVGLIGHGGANKVFYVGLKSLDPAYDSVILETLRGSASYGKDNHKRLWEYVSAKAKALGLTHLSPVSPVCTDPNSEYYIAPAIDPNKNVNTNAIGTRKRNYFIRK